MNGERDDREGGSGDPELRFWSVERAMSAIKSVTAPSLIRTNFLEGAPYHFLRPQQLVRFRHDPQ